MRTAARIAVGISLAASLWGCQSSSTVTTVWKTPQPLPSKPFTKVAAFVVNATPGERRAAEDELAKQILSAQGVAAYTFIPDEDLKQREKVKGVLKSNGFDGAVVLRLVSSDKTTTYFPPTYIDQAYGFYSDGYYSSYNNGSLYRAGYTQTDVVVRGEISVYAVDDGRLLWTGCSSTSDPANVQDLVTQVAVAARQELRKQGVLK